MPFAKGQSGNPGGRGTERLWREAVLKAVRERDGKKGPQLIEKAARALVEAASEGDVSALKELGDRLDGKSAQSVQISGDPDKPLITEIRETIVDPKHP